MPYAVAAAAIAAGGSIFAGSQSAGAAKDAAATQAKAQEAANAEQMQMFNQFTANEAPWLTAGQGGLTAYQKLLGLGPGGTGPSSPLLAMLGYGGPGGTGQINPTQFQGSPGYQFALNQGLKAVTNNARGNLGGNQLQALQATGMGFANQDWNNYLGQFGNAYQALLGNVGNLSAAGQQAAVNLGGAGTTVGANIASGIAGAGNVNAAGIVGAANATGAGVSGATNAIAQLLMNQKFQNSVSGLFGSGGSTGYTIPGNIDSTGGQSSADPGFNP